ncbi:uncharacterized protein LOC124432489 [Vespa crabro]|uniref:uncharacterized protein LOC124432489 n=1 Tax=Vespa crabro TaxID=7445 RepID=UPI001F02517D|nr:uncharacterized protein LOC124432489 [Vespa crabro]
MKEFTNPTSYSRRVRRFLGVWERSRPGPHTGALTNCTSLTAAGRFRERQYQLAAEKRNEAYLRQSYYKETARYFERESGIAKHYDSWNLKLAADPRDSTNLFKTNQEINRTNSTYKKNNMSNWNDQKDRYDNNIDLLARNRKYSARYARRSLENTNVRPGDDIFDNLSRRLQESMMTTTMSTVSSKMADDDKENLNVDVVDDSTTTTPIQTNMIELTDQEDPTIISQDVSDKDYTLNRTEQEITTNNIANDKQIIVDHCDYERERGYPWMRMDPNVKNLSEKMYLYLTYKELKEKIDDLLKKEEHARNRQRWDDAIRLRDMKNELELIREKKIFNMKSLTMDEDVRDRALKNIDERERELALRVDACTDTSMYSDGAKVLWEKWIKEDDRFVIKDATTQREILMKELEEEFQNLAVEDRERIAKTYQSVFNNLHLENRHHLNTNLVAEAKSKSNATGGTD